MQVFPVLTRSAGFDDVTNKGASRELGRWVGLGPGVNLDEVNRGEKVLWKRQNYGNGRTRQSVQITSVSIESTASETDDPKRSSAYSTLQCYTIDWRVKHSALKQLYRNRRRKKIEGNAAVIRLFSSTGVSTRVNNLMPKQD